ncbi:MAG: hypothetical protein IKT27_01670 [Clostridia bacterium]|nr:hypothetical protein [Clostridia bacterium]
MPNESGSCHPALPVASFQLAGALHLAGNPSCPMTGGSNRPPRVAVADFVCGCSTP